MNRSWSDSRTRLTNPEHPTTLDCGVARSSTTGALLPRETSLGLDRSSAPIKARLLLELNDTTTHLIEAGRSPFPVPDKLCRLRRLTQHLLGVYSQGSGNLRFFSCVDSGAARTVVRPIWAGRTMASALRPGQNICMCRRSQCPRVRLFNLDQNSHRNSKTLPRQRRKHRSCGPCRCNEDASPCVAARVSGLGSNCGSFLAQPNVALTRGILAALHRMSN